MSKNPFRKSVDLVKTGSNGIQVNYDTSISRTLHLAGLSSAGNILLALFKILSGILSVSIFTCVNGFYTLGMVAARYCALAGAIRTKKVLEQ